MNEIIIVKLLRQSKYIVITKDEVYTKELNRPVPIITDTMQSNSTVIRVAKELFKFRQECAKTLESIKNSCILVRLIDTKIDFQLCLF